MKRRAKTHQEGSRQERSSGRMCRGKPRVEWHISCASRSSRAHRITSRTVLKMPARLAAGSAIVSDGSSSVDLSRLIDDAPIRTSHILLLLLERCWLAWCHQIAIAHRLCRILLGRSAVVLLSLKALPLMWRLLFPLPCQLRTRLSLPHTCHQLFLGNSHLHPRRA